MSPFFLLVFAVTRNLFPSIHNASNTIFFSFSYSSLCSNFDYFLYYLYDILCWCFSCSDLRQFWFVLQILSSNNEKEEANEKKKTHTMKTLLIISFSTSSLFLSRSWSSPYAFCVRFSFVCHHTSRSYQFPYNNAKFIFKNKWQFL